MTEAKKVIRMLMKGVIREFPFKIIYGEEYIYADNSM